MRCAFSEATHAIIGTDARGGRGVLHWHDNEFDAHRDARDMRSEGAACRVIQAPGGDLAAMDRDSVDSLVSSVAAGY